MSDGSGYAKAGVDTSAADAWVNRIAERVGASGPADLRARMRSGVGAYAAVYDQGAGAPWLAVSCDGVGTKILWAETANGVAAIAQDLVGMNANDLLCVGARPTLFLDYLAVGSLKLVQPGARLGDFIGALTKACAESGMIVVGGETAQMPDVYGTDGYDLAGFTIGFLDPAQFLSVDAVQPGDELWGWTSSGPHSNGFSWLRRLFDAKKDRAVIDAELMAPTRLYARDFLAFRSALEAKERGRDLKAAFHITGSGLLNLLRAQPSGRTIGFDVGEWAARPRPSWVQAVAERAQKEVGFREADLWSTFNMGFGFTVVVSADLGRTAGDLLDSCGLTRLGRVIAEPVVRIGSLTLS